MFVEKLNKKQEGVYVIEEEKDVANGIWEGYLDHDNVNHQTIYIYTGPKLTGEKVENYFISTPSEMPWKTHIKAFSKSEKIYITYETTGDQVEADDINLLQDSLVEEIDRAISEENRIDKKLDNEIVRAITEDEKLSEEVEDLKETKADKTYVDNELANKVDNSRVLTDVPLNAKFTDTVYTHPSTHPASMITESTSRRFVSDTEKNSWNNKAELSDIPTKISQLTNDENYVTQDDLGSAGYGDMLKSIYDTNNNGKVDIAELADNVPWNGVTNKPSTFTPSSHTHSISNVTGLQNALDNKMEKGPVTWNDLKGV